ncbi:MAG: hypothetical protein QME79_05905 [Bacillota bacterium]|nr:hypothetical protein [Bacillota bacterium]
MKTVYFLGVGASAASRFHLPVMKDFFRAEDLDQPRYHRLRDLLSSLFPAASPKDANLEEVVTHLDITLEGPIHRARPTEAEEAYTQLMSYIHERLKLPNGAVGPLHKSLLELVSPDDSVITLNYDEVVENVLYELGRRPDGELDKTSILNRSYSLLQDVQCWAWVERCRYGAR